MRKFSRLALSVTLLEQIIINIEQQCLNAFCLSSFVVKDVKFPLMLDVYELCTAELQEKMLPIRSKFKEMEDKKLEKQQQKVRCCSFVVSA